MFCRVGIELPKMEVRYENLNVEAEAYVGSRGLPTIFNTYANVLEVRSSQGLTDSHCLCLELFPKKKLLHQNSDRNPVCQIHSGKEIM
uniref:Uncharacterized protein n=1 Tax=Arundo donax TaxID=35708 RepID=A0A0A9BVX2_ARUDO